MSSRNLEHLFGPRSVAVIGASDRLHSVGATVMLNVLRGGFGGPVWPVNLRHATVAGREAYRTAMQPAGVLGSCQVILRPGEMVHADVAVTGVAEPIDRELEKRDARGGIGERLAAAAV